ncbi:hypothetical protein TNCV_727931 [Trichonephila clavipes]|nr:hypothetical protein TNCV_727931 [Trichonephila clavipes]
MRKSSIRKHFVENQPVTALIDSGCQIPVLNSSLIRVNQPSEEIITLSSCFGEQRMVEVKPINISLDQHSPGLSVRTAISPTLTEEFIIHPSVYAEIKKLGHAKSDVLLNESESSLGAVSFSNVSVSILVCSVFFVCFRFSSGLDEKGKKGSTAAVSVQSGWPVMASSKAVFARRRSELKLKLLD